MKIPKAIQPIWSAVVDFISDISWERSWAFLNGGMYYSLIEQDHDAIRERLKDNYCIILTRRTCHLTTWLTSLASLIVSGKPAHYTHSLMNVEGDLNGHIGYRLIEATGVGVHYSTFMEVFDCDSVALLIPVGVTLEEWTAVMDDVKQQIGKQYDTLFDIVSDERVSCVELVYQGLRCLPNYKQRYPQLLKLIEDSGNNLTPQMLYDCDELSIVYEARR